MARVRCVVFDLDYTLSHFKNGIESFFRIFTERDVPESVVRDTYEKAVTSNNGFSFKVFLRLLGGPGAGSYQIENNLALCEGWLREELALYPDSLDALNLLSQRRVPTVVLTAGNQLFQQRKICVLALHPEHTFVVSPRHGSSKVIPLELFLRLYNKPIAFVDDMPQMLDQVRDYGMVSQEVETYLMRRADGPYVAKESTYPHTIVTGMNELLEKIGVNR